MRHKMILAVAVAGLVAGSAWAVTAYAGQAAGHKGMFAPKFTPEQRAERMAKVLGLTDAQKNAVVGIITTRRAEIKAVILDKGLARAQKRARIVEIFRSTHANIRALLTPEQQAKFDALTQKIKERIKERRVARQGAQ